MRKNNKYIKILLTLISLFIPVFIFAYRPGANEACKEAQPLLLDKIEAYYYFELDGKEIQPFLPGSEWEKLRKTIGITLNERVSKNCSFGLTIVSGKPKIYCTRHGDTENIKNFLSLLFMRIRPSKLPNFAFIIIICFLGFIFVSCTKSWLDK